MERIRTTWELAKRSWRVVTLDRSLLVLPVLSFLASIAVLAVLMVPAIAIADTSSDAATDESGNPGLIVIGLVAMLAVTVISVFFKGALVAGAHDRFTGGDPTVRSTVRRAFARIPGLVPWALITATVGLILQMLRDRAGGLGRFVVGLAGAAWEVVTFLVVPAIVVDELGAVDGIKRSGALLRETWGENIAAQVGFGLLGLVAMIPAAALVFVGSALGTAAVIAAIVVAVVWVAVVSVVVSAMSAVFQTALYLYATTGEMPAGFEGSGLQATFITR